MQQALPEDAHSQAVLFSHTINEVVKTSPDEREATNSSLAGFQNEGSNPGWPASEKGREAA